MTDLQPFYDARYRDGYRSRLDGYELARWAALEHFLARVVGSTGVGRVVDYGSGAGAFAPLWQRAFPQAELLFCDLSPVALERLARVYPAYQGSCFQIRNNRAELPDEAADVVVSVEVMEHVDNLSAYLSDVYRILRPGGCFVWTTPCANALSVEHVYTALTRQVERSQTGERRWKWEDPGHLRRLKAAEATARLTAAGFVQPLLRYRAHFFSFVCTRYLSARVPARINAALMRLDYTLLRRFPNAASMIGAARKPGPPAASAPGLPSA